MKHNYKVVDSEGKEMQRFRYRSSAVKYIQEMKQELAWEKLEIIQLRVDLFKR